MLDEIIEEVIEFILDLTIGDKLDEKYIEIKEKWRKRREQRAAQKKH